MTEVVQRVGDRLEMPGLATAHSHAFQRALRGRTQRTSGSFWSWRGLMYALSERMTPDDLYALSRFAYLELARAGVTAVGEFHYVHHQPNGAPYDCRTETADTVIEAARSVGLRICLLRVLYLRAGLGRTLEDGQRRFVDPDADAGIQDALDLRDRWETDPTVEVGIAPHSLRACRVQDFVRAGAAAPWPVHAHVSEQRREVWECLAENGRRPVQWLADHGVLDARFVAVHATHLDPSEVGALGASQVCLCRTTERDLGDGLPPTGPLLRAGARLSFGVDSHAWSDPFEEARAVELDERSRVEGRGVTTDAATLLSAATAGGYRAIGMADRQDEDRVELDANALSLVGASDGMLDEAVLYGASASCVEEVRVAGRTIVRSGWHPDEARIRADYRKTLARLGL
ncbi:MAG: formimidoylglutamate deiminase [Sandaracinaceae bacterium]